MCSLGEKSERENLTMTQCCARQKSRLSDRQHWAAHEERERGKQALHHTQFYLETVTHPSPALSHSLDIWWLWTVSLSSLNFFFSASKFFCCLFCAFTLLTLCYSCLFWLSSDVGLCRSHWFTFGLMLWEDEMKSWEIDAKRI